MVNIKNWHKIMRKKKIDVCIFCIANIVFILQSVGYFAPFWFKQEVTLKHGLDGFSVDGRRLQMPFVRNILLERQEQVTPIMNFIYLFINCYHPLNFLFFLSKQDLTLHANCLQCRPVSMGK